VLGLWPPEQHLAVTDDDTGSLPVVLRSSRPEFLGVPAPISERFNDQAGAMVRDRGRRAAARALAMGI